MNVYCAKCVVLGRQQKRSTTDDLGEGANVSRAFAALFDASTFSKNQERLLAHAKAGPAYRVSAPKG